MSEVHGDGGSIKGADLGEGCTKNVYSIRSPDKHDSCYHTEISALSVLIGLFNLFNKQLETAKCSKAF